MTHCRLDRLAPNSVWMLPSATDTIVTSRSSMKTAVQTRISVQVGLCRRGAACFAEGATWAAWAGVRLGAEVAVTAIS